MRRSAHKTLPHSDDGDQAQLHVPNACAHKPAKLPPPQVEVLTIKAEVAHRLAWLTALSSMTEPQRQKLTCAYCQWDQQLWHTVKCCLHKLGCCVCGQAHKGCNCNHLPADMKVAQQALKHMHTQKAGANRALHNALAEQRQQVNAEVQHAACAALHTAFSVWHAAERVAPVAN